MYRIQLLLYLTMFYWLIDITKEEIFEPVLDGELGYREEHKKVEKYFYDLFASILEERLGALGKKVRLEDLKNSLTNLESLYSP